MVLTMLPQLHPMLQLHWFLHQLLLPCYSMILSPLYPWQLPSLHPWPPHYHSCPVSLSCCWSVMVRMKLVLMRILLLMMIVLMVGPP